MHSLGGLVVKDVCHSDLSHYHTLILRQALDRSDRVHDTQPHLGYILPATRGIIFLGTPHRGSGTTSFAKVAANVVRVALRSTNDKLIREIERDSPTLDRLSDNFVRILDRRKFMVWSFVEELATTGVGKVCL